MNNEIGRKLTSLTLMTIMLAAGFSAFAPSTMPEAAAANANLFVSTENSQFQNYFAGPMVTEVVVIDSDIKDTDKGKGEPDVTVNGNKLRMVQATDGNWYGYFADRVQAQTADQTVAATNATAPFLTTGQGLDFGTFCGKDDGDEVLGFAVTQTVGVALPTKMDGSTDGTATITDEQCTGIGALTAIKLNNVVRENKTVNPGSSTVPIGQIGFTNQNTKGQSWPFIQLYNFNPTGNVVVQYNKGGGIQSTTLKFDTVDHFAKTQLDQAKYTNGAQVHVTITDVQLNVDPTDEDSWTFGTNATLASTNYQVFNENGGRAGDLVVKGVIDISASRGALMFEDNGVMHLDTNKGEGYIVRLQDNADSGLVVSATVNATKANTPNTVRTAGGILTGNTEVGAETLPVTITESGPNTGIFGTYDESDVSNLIIGDAAPRGKQGTIRYNEVSNSIVVGFGFGSVAINPTDAEWNSGEEIPVSITDSDANKNSRADEDLDFNSVAVNLIPALSTGDPFTLGEAGVETSTALQVLFVNVTTGSGNIAGSAGNSTINDLGATEQLVFVSGRGVSGAPSVQKFSERAILTPNVTANFRAGAVLVDLATTGDELFKSINNPRGGATTANRFHGFNLLNIDTRGLNSTITNGDVWLLATANTAGPIQVNGAGFLEITPGLTKAYELANATSAQQLFVLNRTATGTTVANANADVVVSNVFTGVRTTDRVGLLYNFTVPPSIPVGIPFTTAQTAIGIDFFSFGFYKDGIVKSDRVNNQIVRIEAEETGDNTGVFDGSLEFVMLNQLNILNSATYAGLSPIADDPTFVVHQDLDDEEAPRVSYNDLAGDGSVTQVSDQEDAPTHSGVTSFNQPTFKIADTVIVTVEDQDLNTDVDLIDIFTVVNVAGDGADDTVGVAGLFTLSNGDPLGRLLDITFDDARWQSTAGSAACDATLATSERGLFQTGFTLIETGSASGIFTGDFIVPAKVCRDASGDLTTARNTQGLDMEVNYVDFRDASGQIVEVGDGAGIRANTGSVSLDRTVYPVPFGSNNDFVATGTISGTIPNARSIFPVHLTAITDQNAGTAQEISAAETLGDGQLTIHVQVNDPDFDTSSAGEDRIAENTVAAAHGPVKVTVSRGNAQVLLAYAGGPALVNGLIDVDANNAVFTAVREIGPITETTPTSGIFEFDLNILYTDGPASAQCPNTLDTGVGGYDSLTSPGSKGLLASRFDAVVPAGSTDFCILQGDIITVEYTDPADASGKVNTVTDSATFDLRNGALQSDKSVYIIGSDMILTLIEPDLDLDNDLAETYDLDLIEWDSDAATVTMGDLGDNAASFDPEPSDLRETGDSTGIYQTVIEIPSTLDGDGLERGEEIVLEYTDWGPSGADFVGQEDEDINLTIFTSNFGATVELDQKVYTWTDKVYITVVAPDHNFDSNLIDELGETDNPLRVATRGNSINNYRLVETGTDTGIFTGEVILVGFSHNVDLDATLEGPTVAAALINTGAGPTDGFLAADDDDGLTVSYEFSEDETVVGSALIRWNIGEVAWLEASYPASGTGVVRVIDPDMNLRPEAVDNFNVDVWSDSDAGGIDLTVTETNEATGIFEGTVFFTTTDDSSGHRLRVAEGDTVTAEYRDETLPDPYTTADELDITGTAFIGTVVPPLERAPASNARVVDAFGNTLDEVSVDQQVQITADLTNGQDREQPFAYLVQIQDENGVTVSLAWITGSLSAGQSFSPALSWIATAPGTYTATVFVWESVDNPTALSPPVSVDITVS